MIGLPENVSIYLCTTPVDFRKGFDGLTGIVTTALIIELQREAQNNLLTLKQKQLTLEQKQLTLSKQAVALELKDKLVAEQAHSLLELKGHNDKLDEKVTELNLRIEKLLQQLFGRKSERRLDGAGQLLLDLGEEASPEVVSALEEAIREAEQNR